MVFLWLYLGTFCTSIPLSVNQIVIFTRKKIMIKRRNILFSSSRGFSNTFFVTLTNHPIDPDKPLSWTVLSTSTIVIIISDKCNTSLKSLLKRREEKTQEPCPFSLVCLSEEVGKKEGRGWIQPNPYCKALYLEQRYYGQISV